MNRYQDNEDIKEKLENLSLPHVEMPAHKEQLKKMLFAYSVHTRNKRRCYLEAPEKIAEVIRLKKKALIFIIPSLLILLTVLCVHLFSPPSQAMAGLTLQVNPLVSMVLDDDNTVIEIMGQNEEGIEIVSISDLEGKKLNEVLEEITSIMFEQGYLLPDSTVAMTVHGLDNPDMEKLSAISDLAKETVQENLTRLNISAQVESFVLSEELYAFLDELGLTPADYVELLKANLTEDEIKEVIKSLEQTENEAEALPYLKFKLKIKSDEHELFAEFKQKQFGDLAKVMIKQQGQKHIQLKDTGALEYLLPILEKLELNTSMSKEQIVERVVELFGWEGPYEEFKIEVKFADKSSIDFKCKAKKEDAERERERERERETALPYREFELEIESDLRKLSVDFEQENDGIYARVKIKQDGQKPAQLKDSAALEYLLPILEKLELNASMDKQQVVDRVVAAFGWDEPYEELEIKVKFANRSSLDFKWKNLDMDEVDDDDDDD